MIDLRRHQEQRMKCAENSKPFCCAFRRGIIFFGVFAAFLTIFPDKATAQTRTVAMVVPMCDTPLFSGSQLVQLTQLEIATTGSTLGSLITARPDTPPHIPTDTIVIRLHMASCSEQTVLLSVSVSGGYRVEQTVPILASDPTHAARSLAAAVGSALRLWIESSGQSLPPSLPPQFVEVVPETPEPVVMPQTVTPEQQAEPPTPVVTPLTTRRMNFDLSLGGEVRFNVAPFTDFYGSRTDFWFEWPALAGLRIGFSFTFLYSYDRGTLEPIGMWLFGGSFSLGLRCHLNSWLSITPLLRFEALYYEVHKAWHYSHEDPVLGVGGGVRFDFAASRIVRPWIEIETQMTVLGVEVYDEMNTPVPVMGVELFNVAILFGLEFSILR